MAVLLCAEEANDESLVSCANLCEFLQTSDVNWIELRLKDGLGVSEGGIKSSERAWKKAKDAPLDVIVQ